MILENIHEEKFLVMKKKFLVIKKNKFLQLQEKWLMRQETFKVIDGSGKNGLILKEDIMSMMGSKPSPSERKIKYGPEERVKMTRLRLIITKIKGSPRKCSNAYNF